MLFLEGVWPWEEATLKIKKAGGGFGGRAQRLPPRSTFSTILFPSLFQQPPFFNNTLPPPSSTKNPPPPLNKPPCPFVLLKGGGCSKGGRGCFRGKGGVLWLAEVSFPPPPLTTPWPLPIEPVSFFQHVQSKCSFSWNLETKFCLHAAGGIYVEHNFANSGGEIKISGSSKTERGGAVLRSFSLGLWHDFEMAVGSGRSTPGSEIQKKWDFHRFPWSDINVCDKAWLPIGSSLDVL